MERRKNPLVNGYYYHVFSRSIAKFEIFKSDDDYLRMIKILDLYRYIDFNYKYSGFCELELSSQNAIIFNLNKSNLVLAEIVAFCIMPTHLHLILKQVVTHGISKYIAKVLNSYTRYFNVNNHRTGPLWTGRFKSVLVSSDEQLLHLTRYIHLNPTSAKIVKKPEDWLFSSFREYIGLKQEKICSFENLFDFSSKEYKKFVLDRKSYQQEISRIKNILIDNYTG